MPVQLAYAIYVPIETIGSATVEIRLSTRSRRHCHAHLEEGKVVVTVPATMSPADREEMARQLARRLLVPKGRRITSDADLELRAHELADRYLEGVRPTSIRWVTNQGRRWGSCSPATGRIRLSARLRSFPSFVVDSVIVHELSHLIEPSHSPHFWELARRFPRHKEAEAFLEGFEHGRGNIGSSDSETLVDEPED
jgi:predicted metal-dependent hydrolase